MEARQDTGICRHCGQIVNLAWIGNLKTGDPEYLASRYCTCPDARKFNDAEEKREEAEAIRAIVLGNARKAIDDLFGPEAENIQRNPDIRPMSEKLLGLLYELSEVTYDHEITKVGFTDVQGISVKMRRTAKGNLDIVYSYTDSASHEI